MNELRVYKNYFVRNPPNIADPDLNNWTRLPDIQTGQMGKKPVYIEVQNLASNIFSVAGYIMALRIPGLITNEIGWVDSLQSTVYYEEFNTNENSLGACYEVYIRRLSGPDNLAADPNLAGINAVVTNPTLMFSLVYHF